MKFNSFSKIILAVSISLLSFSSQASMTVPVQLVSGDQSGKVIGSVQFENTHGGVLLTPDLNGLPPGIHGFHIHEKPSCDDHGMVAGGHFDPMASGKHLGPYQHGHKGDLPVLIVDKNGRATLPVLAPNITLAQLKNHALMIHAGGDNYSDLPEKLGGGGERIACGVIK